MLISVSYLLFILDWFLFQLVVLLKPDSNCFNSFILPWADKVTTGA